ncbi:MAG: (2Fe-2S) ferredoxin domain-containing protein [Coleofasciculaceae cyanobacterium]
MVEESEIASKSILVCQNTTCCKQGSAQVLASFTTNSIAGVEVAGCGCLGQCGNGPMVLVLPEHIWYNHVAPDEVSRVVKQHLRGGKPVESMLYRKFHPASRHNQRLRINSLLTWFFIVSLIVGSAIFFGRLL